MNTFIMHKMQFKKSSHFPLKSKLNFLDSPTYVWYKVFFPKNASKKRNQNFLQWPTYVSLFNCIAGRIQEINGPSLTFFNIIPKPIAITEIFFNRIKANNIITNSYFTIHRDMGSFYAPFQGPKSRHNFHTFDFMEQNSTLR